MRMVDEFRDDEIDYPEEGNLADLEDDIFEDDHLDPDLEDMEDEDLEDDEDDLDDEEDE